MGQLTLFQKCMIPDVGQLTLLLYTVRSVANHTERVAILFGL